MDDLRALTAEADDDTEAAKQDALLADIEADGRVPGWAWRPMLDTVAHLRALPPGYGHVATRYLQFVRTRGAAFFGEEHHYQAAMWGEREAPTVRCRCGADPKADRPVRRNHVEIAVALCHNCGQTTVQYDGEPYDRPTLITAAM